MSKMLKIVLALAVLAIVIGGLYFWFFHKEEMSAPVAAPAAESSDTLPTGKDTSDTSLNTDLQAIDGQMNSFKGDNASIDASVSDQSVDQSSL